MLYIALQADLSSTLLIQTAFAGMASFPLLAIPLFLLAGNLMKEGGITEDLVSFARLLLGHIHGGLGVATIFASAVFAAVTGSAVATAVAIGTIMLPVMTETGYEQDTAAAVTATAACMGPIIPPSIPFIIYGVIANVSIASLFLAGVLPGLLLGAALAVYMMVVSQKKGYPRRPKAGARERAAGGLRALPALCMPVLVVGGIFWGIFTPTEASGIAVAYAFVVGTCVYRKLRLARIPRILLQSGLETAVVMLLLGLSEPFAWVVAVEQAAARIVEWMGQVTTSPAVFLLVINLFLLIVGIPLETAPALTIVTPVLAPLAAKLQIDPVHFGVIVCFNLVLGLVTPPVGAVLFSLCGITGMSLETLSRRIWAPFCIALAVLLLVTFFPPLATLLPGLF